MITQQLNKQDKLLQISLVNKAKLKIEKQLSVNINKTDLMALILQKEERRKVCFEKVSQIYQQIDINLGNYQNANEIEQNIMSILKERRILKSTVQTV
jgi:hypothetical protein